MSYSAGARTAVLVKKWPQQCVVVQLVQGLCAMLVDWCGQTRYIYMLKHAEFFLSDGWHDHRFITSYHLYFVLLGDPFYAFSCTSSGHRKVRWIWKEPLDTSLTNNFIKNLGVKLNKLWHYQRIIQGEYMHTVLIRWVYSRSNLKLVDCAPKCHSCE